MSDEQLNTAIDDVARRMTEGSPAGDAGFRRRILARIESGDAPRARWRPLFVVVPLAATIVIAVVVTRSRPGPFAPGAPAATPITASPKGPAPQEALRRPGPSASARTETPRAPARRAEAPEARRPFGPGLSGAAPHLDPIDAIETIAVAPLGTVDPLAPDPISIERLETIVPLVVAPLDAIEEQRRYE